MTIEALQELATLFEGVEPGTDLGIEKYEKSRLLRGHRAPSEAALARACAAAEVDLGEALILKALVHARGDGVAGAWREILGAWKGREVVDPAPRPAFATLPHWREALDVRAVLVGDRRRRDPTAAADALAYSASTEDLCHLPALRLPARTVIVGDRRLPALNTPVEELPRWLRKDLLVIGSHRVNRTIWLLQDAVFQVALPAGTSDAYSSLEEAVARAAGRGASDATLAQFRDNRTDPGAWAESILEKTREGVMLDPIRGDAQTFGTELQPLGMVTLGLNPWAPKEGLVIWVAASSKLASVAGVRLLAEPERSFEHHPYGGVFRVAAQAGAAGRRDPERYTGAPAPTFVTPEYRLEGSTVDNELPRFLTTLRANRQALKLLGYGMEGCEATRNLVRSRPEA